MKNAKVISVILQKGGQNKTSTSLILGNSLALLEKKVLICDLDGQASLTFATGIDTTDTPTLYNVLKGEVNICDAIQSMGNTDILPSNSLMDIPDVEFSDTDMLKRVLCEVRSKYDYIILDCPPNLGITSVNALVASTDVIIPMNAEVFSLQGFSQLLDTIQSVRIHSNENLNMLGILLTKFNARAKLHQNIREMLVNMQEQTGVSVFNTVIRQSISVPESQIKQQSLFEYNKKSTACLDYQAFTQELLNILEGGLN